MIQKNCAKTLINPHTGIHVMRSMFFKLEKEILYSDLFYRRSLLLITFWFLRFFLRWMNGLGDIVFA